MVMLASPRPKIERYSSDSTFEQPYRRAVKRFEKPHSRAHGNSFAPSRRASACKSLDRIEIAQRIYESCDRLESTNNDGSVNGGDLPSFASSFNKSVGNPDYNSRADWNLDGSVNGNDLTLYVANFNCSIPNGEPGLVSFSPPPPSSPERDSDSEPEELSTPFIDAFFSKLDEEDELLMMDEEIFYQ